MDPTKVQILIGMYEPQRGVCELCQQPLKQGGCRYVLSEKVDYRPATREVVLEYVLCMGIHHKGCHKARRAEEFLAQQAMASPECDISDMQGWKVYAHSE